MADRRGAPEDEGGLASVLGVAALLVRRNEADRLAVGRVVPYASRNGRQPERNGRGLIERDVLGDLHGARGNVDVRSDENIHFHALEDRHKTAYLCRNLRRHDGILLERRLVVREPALEETAGTWDKIGGQYAAL